MKRKIELLAPGGDIDSIKAAICAGADAVYCGLNKFNARNRAANINFEDLNGILNLAHNNNCKVFLTLNILIVGSEFSYLVSLLNKLINTEIDGVIVQDFGLFYLLSKYFKGLKIHASTQLNTHNKGQINFLNKLAATRVNLPRELNIHEIKALTAIAHKKNILTEIFVHGSYCISFSGICYLSSALFGKSGNRGRCSQPCRDRYLTTPEGKNYPLNLKDNSAYFDLRKISDARVDAIKIEGRIKKFDYVYTVVSCWKKQVESFYNHNRLNTDNSDLYRVFNRDFSNSYLKGDINKNMFIDNPRDNTIQHLLDINNYDSIEKEENGKIELYDEKDEITHRVKNKIKKLSIAGFPLAIGNSEKLDTPLNRIHPIEVPFLKKEAPLTIKPVLAVLISSRKELYFLNKTSADIYFQLPSSFKNEYSELTDLFLKHRKLIPFFPSVLIGENYSVAIKFLNQVNPELIVTNNTGIAFEACQKKIPWIAGPCLNMVNSFSILCLKEKFNCCGSFISNEISKYQIKSIIRPENFKLYYSIYHPILLLTSRQCLLHQVTGCEKSSIDGECIERCHKSFSITNFKKGSLVIEKSKGNYHCIYNNINFMNTDIVKDIPDIFSGFLIDLRQIKTETKLGADKLRIIQLFENLLSKKPRAEKELTQMIHPTTDTQYTKGI